MTVRTRFAPSPTGRLHLGNVRAAVINWLLARRHHGAFILRIEDTDVERNVAGGEEDILEDLRWLGLDWDEGPDVGGPHGPYRQSQRQDGYDAAVERLLAAGLAYPCFCGEEELDADAATGKEGREVHRYPGRCRALSGEERARLSASGPPPVIRFAVPEGSESVDIEDEVFGSISFPVSDIDDFVIRRSDGRVTYNFAVVVDDVDMEITHVVRGVGHLSNTPKQALIFDALGRPRPVFAHLPTVLGADGRKLSKREGSASVPGLRAVGYPPIGVLNYLSLLGWSHPDEREVLTRDELIATSGLDRIGRSDTQVDPAKLHWISSQHLARESLDQLTDHVAPFVDATRFPSAGEHLPEVVEALRTRLGTYGEVNEHLPLLFPEDPGLLAKARADVVASEEGWQVVRAVRDRLASSTEWESGALGRTVREVGAATGVRGAR
ncbi:MAG: glutamate--tRNA ligase, partial [Gemmatimonadetes bacterium]|nr:glutamate--tRNA ligase [Gemmatimonadota bacterium]